jgi:hypothetical protein
VPRRRRVSHLAASRAGGGALHRLVLGRLNGGARRRPPASLAGLARPAREGAPGLGVDGAAGLVGEQLVTARRLRARYARAISSLFAPSSRMPRQTAKKASASWSRAKTFTAIGPSGIEGVASRS